LNGSTPAELAGIKVEGEKKAHFDLKFSISEREGIKEGINDWMSSLQT
jgi:hypothetical protein